ncbi:MAG TPA: feruloyl-CoA synthase [Xanthobacteraceae bacterium]|nr:feruloyl-CoA synthase [Xanthobacteraceae bacterium]
MSSLAHASATLRDPNIPQRPVRLGPRDVVMRRGQDGAIYLRSPHALGPYPAKLTERLVHWAQAAPERIFLAQRDAAGAWRTFSYSEALAQVRRIGQALLKRNLSSERPIVILSENDIAHALLGLAANYVGIPYAPISPAYSLVSTDLARLRHILTLLTPGLVFAADGAKYRRAIEAVVPLSVELAVVGNPPNRPATLFSELCMEAPSAAVEAAHAQVGPETVAKFLFTSGSTGHPKAVINTQRMWCANQEMIRSVLCYFEDEPPVLVDWAPWHHTAGGNHDVGLVLYNGGTLYIDEGKPAPGAIETTVRNLREVAPTWYFTVPKGYEELLPYLRNDVALCKNFFSRLKVLWFAGAGIAQHVFDEIKQLAIKTCGERILFLTGFGATETAPCALARTWEAELAANMGLPVPGLELKLVPVEGKLEARVKGPNVTPGYWRQPELNPAAFDEEGFYRLGDAFKFADPDDPAQGLLFDGRTAEDFKLSSGTWVSTGPLRLQVIRALAPLAQDVVISGPDRDAIGILVFPNLDACRRFATNLRTDAPADTILNNSGVREAIRERLVALAKLSTGGSNRVCRAMLLIEPPSLDAGEITDKGSINQRMVLRQRAALVERLHATPPSPEVIAIDDAR